MAPKDNQNDFLTGDVPAPDDPVTPAERAHAKTFAELVDKALVDDHASYSQVALGFLQQEGLTS